MSDRGEMKPERDKKTRKLTGRMVPREKYEDVYRTPFDRALIQKHLAGDVTYSATVDNNGTTRIGAIDVDYGGRAALQACLDAARLRGIVAVAIEAEPGAHTGGHAVAFYGISVSAEAATYQMRQIAADAGLPEKTEVWPGANQGIRILFGVHRITGKRGTLLTQSGELLNLDNDQELPAALDLVMALPMNPAPPDPPKVERPTTLRTPTERKISTGESAAEQMRLQERYAQARTYLIDTYDLVTELENAGAVQTRDGYSCPFCEHSHDTTLTIAPSGTAGYSHSPTCLLSSARGFDVTNVLMLSGRYANFDKLARALAPHCFPPPAAPTVSKRTFVGPGAPTPAERKARAADAQRKRDARKQAAADLRADIIGRAAVDPDMPACARRQLDIHLTIADTRNWHRASVARQAELAGYSERWTQIANRYLIEHGYLRRDETSAATTAIWTFTREAGRSPVETSGAADARCEMLNRSPVLDLERDLIPVSLLACEGPPLTPHERACESDALDTWEWADDTHGGDELNLLDCESAAPSEPVSVNGLQIEPLATPDTGHSVEGVQYADGRVAWWLWDDASDTVVGEYRTEALARDAAFVAQHSGKLPTFGTFAPSEDAVPSESGASYTPPSVEPTGRAVYDHGTRPRDVYTRESAWRDIWTRMACRPDAGDATEPIPLDVEPAPEPLVRCPPSDPKKAERYGKLRSKAKYATSPGQRVALNRVADALMDVLTASEAAARRGDSGARRSQANPAAIRPPAAGSGMASGLAQAAMFGGAGYD
jgi:hypothetical protein